MKRYLLAGVSLLALAIAGPNAEAAPFTFSYSGKAADFVVPDTGIYRIIAYGAQGGNAPGEPNTGVIYTGGKGAEIGGDFNLTAGEKLRIHVGGVGGNSGYSHGRSGGGGGGGGSFVIVDSNKYPLVVAGAGGGASAYSPGGGHNGYGASTDTSGRDGGGEVFHRGSGGINGSGGSGGGYGGGGGGGGIVNGGSDGTYASGGVGGRGYASLTGGSGNYGGGDGGFGGGGGGGGGKVCDVCGDWYGGGGGGGGWSGGGGGSGSSLISDSGYGGGGGGSFINQSLNQILNPGIQEGNGEVVITELTGAAPVPEPGSLALLGAGLAGLAAIRRRSKA